MKEAMECAFRYMRNGCVRTVRRKVEFMSGCYRVVYIRPPQTLWHDGMGGGHGSGGLQACRTLKFLVGSFGLDFILFTQGSILDPCYEI